jgi:hypothetical protein
MSIWKVILRISAVLMVLMWLKGKICKLSMSSRVQAGMWSFSWLKTHNFDLIHLILYRIHQHICTIIDVIIDIGIDY